MTLQANAHLNTHADQGQGVNCLWTHTYAEVVHKCEEHYYTLPCKQSKYKTYAFRVMFKLSTRDCCTPATGCSHSQNSVCTLDGGEPMCYDQNSMISHHPVQSFLHDSLAVCI